MDLKAEGRRIDKALMEEYDKWVRESQELDRRIAEQDAILRSDEAQGDRSENAVFQNAADTRSALYLEKGELEEKMRSYREEFKAYATREESRGPSVQIGSVVHFVESSIGREFVVKIVPRKADAPQKGAVSVTSPVGRSLLNRKQGDTVECKTERRTWKYTIKEVF